MKAFLLAAGIGSRLRPITDTIPKCMLDIDGRPLLDIWLDAFGRAGVDEVARQSPSSARRRAPPPRYPSQAARRPRPFRTGTARQCRHAGR